MEKQSCQECGQEKSNRFCKNCNKKTHTAHSAIFNETIGVQDTMKYSDANDGQPVFKRKYEELERCLTRLQKLYDGLIINSDGEDSLQSPKDYARNFFRVSYELKEMLKEDPGVNISSSTIEGFCRQNQWAGLCIDIANQTKHGIWRIFSNRRKTNKNIGQINAHVHVLSPTQTDRTELTIEIDGKKEDCLQIAKKALSAWQQFLQTNNLLD